MVRQATEADAEEIARVWIVAWRWAYPSVLPEEFIESRSDLAQRTANVRADLARGPLFVMEDKTLLGFVRGQVPASLPGFDSEIGGLYVHPDATRRGVGRTLVQAMACEFLVNGCRSMAIQTLRDNSIGRSFYEKIGGRVEAADEWRGFPCVWYGWNEAGLKSLKGS